MHRRRPTLTTSLAGLLASPPTRPPTDTDGQPPLRLVGVTVEVPTDAPFHLDAHLVDRQISRERTASFDLAVEWRHKEPKSLVFEFVYPFAEPPRSDRPEGLQLVPGRYTPPRAIRGYWVPDSDDLASLGQQVPTVERTFSAGGTVAGRWQVWSDPATGRAIEPGTYSFADEIRVASETGERGEVESIPWSLTLTIE